MNTLHEVEQLAASRGVRFTKADYENIRKAQAEARKQYRAELAEAASTATWADRFMIWYPKLLESIASAGNIIISLSQSIIANIGAPIVLVALLIVEQQRVLHGMQLFETDDNLASFGAWALVISNLLLEIIAHHVEYTHGYTAERAARWSLRLWAKNAAYRLGLSSNWKEQQLSPAAWAHGLLAMVTFAILALALGGSMRDVISQTSGAWYDAIIAIFTQSSLINMVTWAGGVLFAGAAVLTAQGLSRYLAIRTVEIRAQMTNSDDLTAVADQAAATAAQALLVAKLQNRKQAVEPVTIAVNPTPAPEQNHYEPVLARQNGNHRG